MSNPNFVRMIYDFNEQIIGTPVDQEINPLSKAQKEWTVKAFNEEIVEFEKGYESQDVVEMADACLDLVYFAIGTLKKMGITEENAILFMNIIHSANMTKKKGGVAARGDFDQDAVKPPEFVAPNEAMRQILFGGG